MKISEEFETQISKFQKFGMKLGLERIEYLLGQLGNPQRKFKSIHVAGTNGKGSVCAMTASILKEAGYKVGLYTSPHLFKYNERIKINGKDISDKDLNRYFSMLEPRLSASGSDSPTIFEILTAIAFKYFAYKKVDIAVVEVGLGGRFDATNVLVPEVSVITNIDYEHTEHLGKTLAKIAFEKAGIIKDGVPVVTGENKKEALDVILNISKQKKSNVETCYSMSTQFRESNKAITLKIFKFLKNFKASKKAIEAGLRKVRWPGRFQVVKKKPLVIVDGAHNPAGIKALVKTLEKQKIPKPMTLIFGAQKNKDTKSMLKIISPLAEKIIITRSSHPQAMPLNNQLSKLMNRNFVIIPNAKMAFKKAVGDESAKSVLVCGSIFLVADTLS